MFSRDRMIMILFFFLWMPENANKKKYFLSLVALFRYVYTIIQPRLYAHRARKNNAEKRCPMEN